MRFWIYTAVTFAVITTLMPMLRGDGMGAGKGFVSGFGVLVLVLMVAGLVWLVRLPFRKKQGDGS